MKLKSLFLHPIVGALLVAGAVFLCFFPVRNFSFLNFDDDIYVTGNWFVGAGLTSPGIAQALRDTSTGHWHPLSWLSLMLDAEFFGVNPAAFHLTNAVLHAASCGILFLALLMMTRSAGRSATAALLFGLHPLRIESVVWVSQRKDVLSLFLAMVTLLFYAAYVKRSRWYWYAGMCFAFCAALLAKPTIVTLPLLLLVLDFWPLQRLSRASIIEKLPLFGLSALFSLVFLYAQRAGAGLRDLSEVAISDRAANAMVGFLSYFGKLFFPNDLGIFYPLVSYAPGIGVGCFFGLLAISWCLFASWREKPYLAAGWGWFVISLIPMIGFIHIGGQTFADRWTYLPHIGLLIASVWLVADVLKRSNVKRCEPFVAGIACAFCFSLTQLNLPYWAESETLFRRTLEVSPNNFMAHTNLGAALDVKGRLDEAVIHFEEAVRLNPTYPEALNNLGALRARQNRMQEAIPLFQRALAIRPRFARARYHLGLAFHAGGRPYAAAGEWVQVLDAEPRSSEARASLQFLERNSQLSSCSVTEAADRAALSRVLEAWSAGEQDAALRAWLLGVAHCSAR